MVSGLDSALGQLVHAAVAPFGSGGLGGGEEEDMTDEEDGDGGTVYDDDELAGWEREAEEREACADVDASWLRERGHADVSRGSTAPSS